MVYFHFCFKWNIWKSLNSKILLKSVYIFIQKYIYIYIYAFNACLDIYKYMIYIVCYKDSYYNKNNA